MFKSFAKNLRIIKYVFRFCPTYVFFSLIYIAANAVGSIAKIFLIKEIIDLVVNASDFGEVKSAIILYLIVITGTTLVKVVYDNFLFNHYRTIYIGKIQSLMYSMTKTVDYEDFDNPEFYDKYSRALRDGSTRGIRVYEDLVRFFSSMVNALAIGSIILITDAILLAIVFVSSAVLVVGTNLINKKWYQLYKDTETNNRMYRYVNRTFYQQKFAAEIKTTSIGDLLVRRYQDNARIINKAHLKTQFQVALLTLMNQFGAVFLEQGGTYLYLAYKLFRGLVNLGEFTSVLNAALSFSASFVEAVSFLTRIKLNAMYIDDFLWYVDYKPKLETTGKDLPAGPLLALAVENLSFKYPNNEPYTLENIDLKIRQGEKLAIVGLNGAGKTTLIKLLLKFYEHEEGKILYNDQEYRGLVEKALRRKFSIVFQDFQIYALSITENVLMRKAENETDLELVWRALEKVGLKEQVRALPKGLETMVTKEFDDEGVVFSGGDRQKLAIARVFASDAAVYILDEPTSSLDPYAEKAINDLIITNAGNKTIIIIAHRLSTVVDVDQIILIEHGKIIEEGNHLELLTQKGRYNELFTTQASMYKKNGFHDEPAAAETEKTELAVPGPLAETD